MSSHCEQGPETDAEASTGPTFLTKRSPKVDFGLLPVAINDTAANITAAIRLRAHSGVRGEAGAFLILAQATLGATSSPSAGGCQHAFAVDVEANAGGRTRAWASVATTTKRRSRRRRTAEAATAPATGPGPPPVFYQGGITARLPAARAKESEEGDKDGKKDDENSASVLWGSQAGLLSLLGFFLVVMIWL